jgi:hypothetical protein
MLAGFFFKTLNENGVRTDNHFDLDQVLIKIDKDRRLKNLYAEVRVFILLSNLIQGLND